MKSNNSILFFGVVTVGLGIYFLSNKKTTQQSAVEIDDDNQLPIESYTGILVNGNKVLKIGVGGYETLQLQSLLGMFQNGVFDIQTETALFKKKGVKQITLNQWSTIPNLI